jgi:hypothetical protein
MGELSLVEMKWEYACFINRCFIYFDRFIPRIGIDCIKLKVIRLCVVKEAILLIILATFCFTTPTAVDFREKRHLVLSSLSPQLQSQAYVGNVGVRMGGSENKAHGLRQRPERGGITESGIRRILTYVDD